MGVREMLVNYLGAGIAQADAARASGVSESYVSQLMTGDEEFASLVRERRAAQVSRYVEMDSIADETQHTALARLQKVIMMEARPQVLMRAIETLDKMKRRSTPATSGDNHNNVGMVKIVLPASTAARYTISVDTNNRVVQVDAHTMVPASGHQIAQMAEVVAKETQHERGTEAGVLLITEGGTRSPEAHRSLPEAAAPRTDTVGVISRALASSGRESLGTFDGTIGSML